MASIEIVPLDDYPCLLAKGFQKVKKPEDGAVGSKVDPTMAEGEANGSGPVESRRITPIVLAGYW
jgi:hypothetical protein